MAYYADGLKHLSLLEKNLTYALLTILEMFFLVFVCVIMNVLKSIVMILDCYDNLLRSCMRTVVIDE